MICDEEIFLKEGQFEILGYITLALKTLHIPNGLSVRKRKNLDGISGKIHGELITSIPCYLIGQLARNDNVAKDKLTGRELIEDAHRFIMTAANIVGGRYIMIECRDNPQLVKFYEENGFCEFAQIDDKGIKMKQMLCKLQK